MKRILIIQGNPHPGSYCSALATAYQQAALSAGHEAQLIHLHDLNFELNLRHGYRQRTPWEPDLETTWAAIQAADHLVWVYPTWWGGMPALLKGFIDRVFLPGKPLSTATTLFSGINYFNINRGVSSSPWIRPPGTTA